MCDNIMVNFKSDRHKNDEGDFKLLNRYRYRV